MKGVFGPHTFRQYPYKLSCIAELERRPAARGQVATRAVSFRKQNITSFDSKKLEVPRSAHCSWMAEAITANDPGWSLDVRLSDVQRQLGVAPLLLLQGGAA